MAKQKQKSTKSLRVNSSGLVPRLVRRTRSIIGAYAETLGPNENMLSLNRITGYSINFPIAATCSPSRICASTCYFARDSNTWPNSLRKQYRVFNTVRANPLAAAKRLAGEVEKRFQSGTLTFLRWNGGGDLFHESVECLNELAVLCPHVPLWVVTRSPEMAARIADAPNVFLHFSLDAASLDRRRQLLQLSPSCRNLFFSYQCDRDESPPKDRLSGISVLFYNCYVPLGARSHIPKSIVCPLNTRSTLDGTCENCRRCFDGTAVKHARRHRARP
jgi:hypothetical protein